MSCIALANFVTAPIHLTRGKVQSGLPKKMLWSLSSSHSCSYTASLRPSQIKRSVSRSFAYRAGSSKTAIVCTATVEEIDDTTAPTIRIDNLTDPMATILHVKFGNYLGDLLDTMAGLRNLGLNIGKASLNPDDPEKTFYITDAENSLKVTDSIRLEEMKSVVMTTMMDFHPEATSMLAAGIPKGRAKRRGPLEPREVPPIPTSIKVWDDQGVRSRLDIVTTDRQGLLVDVVKLLKDISVNVVSAEIDTIGVMAHDIFFLNYKGEALNSSMEELVKNALYYHLAMTEIATNESY